MTPPRRTWRRPTCPIPFRLRRSCASGDLANRGEVLDLPDGQEGRSPAIIRPVRVLSTAALAATLLCGATGASAKTTWLCKPGLKHS